MNLRVSMLGLAVCALVACGSKEKTDETKGAVGDGVKALAGSTAAQGAAAEGAMVNPGAAGPSKTLFKGKFQGIFSAGKTLSQGELTNVFGSGSKPTITPVATNASAATSSAKTQPLWAFSPADAAFGVVVADGAFAKVQAMAAGAEKMLAGGPGGAMVVAMIRKEAMAEIGLDPFNPAAWAANAGIDQSKGFAMFASTGGNVAVVLPVSDPAKFRAAIKDNDGDLGDGHCVMAQPGRYVCSDKLEYAKQTVAKHDSPLAQRAAQLPSWLRGDVELVTHLASFPNAMQELAPLRQALQTVGTLSMAANLDNGALSVRAWLEGKRGGPVGGAMAALPGASLTGQSAGAVNWFHLRLPMELILATVPASVPMGPGLDFRRDVLDNLTGEIVTYSRGKHFLSENLVLALKDPAPVARAVEGACKLAMGAGVIAKAKAGAGSCEGSIDLAGAMGHDPELAAIAAGMPPVPISLAVSGKNLEMKFGWPTPPSGNAGDMASAGISKEIATGNWHGVWWGMALDPLGVAPSVLQQRVTKLLGGIDAEDRNKLALIRWLYGHMYDAGLAFALREDGMYALMEVTTFAADPPAAYAAHEAALGKLVAADYDGYRLAIAANADLKGTLAGKHAAAVKGGAPVLGQFGPWTAFGAIGAFTSKKIDEPATAYPEP